MSWKIILHCVRLREYTILFFHFKALQTYVNRFLAHWMSYYYRPQLSWGKVMFLHVSVHRAPTRADTPYWADTPLGRHPPRQTPPGQSPPLGRPPP